MPHNSLTIAHSLHEPLGHQATSLAIATSNLRHRNWLKEDEWEGRESEGHLKAQDALLSPSIPSFKTSLSSALGGPSMMNESVDADDATVAVEKQQFLRLNIIRHKLSSLDFKSEQSQFT